MTPTGHDELTRLSEREHGWASRALLAEAELASVNAQLAAAVEAVSQVPERWSFRTLVFIARRILDFDYPADLFRTEPKFIVQLRALIVRIEENL